MHIDIAFDINYPKSAEHEFCEPTGMAQADLKIKSLFKFCLCPATAGGDRLIKSYLS
jgi:hypothetical protein